MYIIGEDWSVEMKTLIIIPAYNEEENIERVVNMLVTSYPQYDYVVVNDCLKIIQNSSAKRITITL